MWSSHNYEQQYSTYKITSVALVLRASSCSYQILWSLWEFKLDRHEHHLSHFQIWQFAIFLLQNIMKTTWDYGLVNLIYQWLQFKSPLLLKIRNNIENRFIYNLWRYSLTKQTWLRLRKKEERLWDNEKRNTTLAKELEIKQKPPKFYSNLKNITKQYLLPDQNESSCNIYCMIVDLCLWHLSLWTDWVHKGEWLKYYWHYLASLHENKCQCRYKDEAPFIDL